MTSEKRSKKFEKRIKFVLSNRKQHPWGIGIGLKGTMINSIFKGKTPGPEPLIKIHTAEGVRIDWLLGLDDGPPFKVRHNLEDAASAMYIKTLASTGFEPILLIDENGRACVVATRPEHIKYDAETEAKYIVVEILPNIGKESVEALESVNTHYSLIIRSDVLSKIAKGWVSPYELTCDGGILSRKERVKRTNEISKLVAEYSVDNSSAEDLIRRAGQLKHTEQEGTPLNELYVLLDVFRYLEPEALKRLMETARNLAAEQLANHYDSDNSHKKVGE